MTTLTYTQEEKEKHFIGKLKFPIPFIDRGLSINLNLETAKISDGKGFIGSFYEKDENWLANGSKILLGLTWSSYYNKASIISLEALDNILTEFARINNIHHYKKPADLLEWTPAYYYYRDVFFHEKKT